MDKRFYMFLLIVIAVALAGASTAETGESDSSTEPVAAEPTVDMAGETLPVRGMQVFKDADTGEMRAPTAKEAAELSKQLREMFGNRKVAEPRGFTYKNGMTSWQIDPSLFKFSVARVEADGTITTDCIQGPEKTLEYVETSSTTNGPAEE